MKKIYLYKNFMPVDTNNNLILFNKMYTQMNYLLILIKSARPLHRSVCSTATWQATLDTPHLHNDIDITVIFLHALLYHATVLLEM